MLESISWKQPVLSNEDAEFFAQGNNKSLWWGSNSRLADALTTSPKRLSVFVLRIRSLFVQQYVLSLISSSLFLCSNLSLFIPSFIPSFLPVCMYVFLTSFCHSFLPSFLPVCMYVFLTSFSHSFLPSLNRANLFISYIRGLFVNYWDTACNSYTPDVTFSTKECSAYLQGDAPLMSSAIGRE